MEDDVHEDPQQNFFVSWLADFTIMIDANMVDRGTKRWREDTDEGDCSSGDLPPLRAFSAGTKGRKHTMEDVPLLVPHLGKNRSFYAVLDGCVRMPHLYPRSAPWI